MEDGGREGNFQGEREGGWLMENTRGQNDCSVFEEQKKDLVVGAGERERFQK